MPENEELDLEILKASRDDIGVLEQLILGLATYEKRPEDATGTREGLLYWLFERNIATALLAKSGDECIGYALYYPVFGSFSAVGKVHLEDVFIKPEYRGNGLGTCFMSKIAERVLAEGYGGMEWNALDWNASAIDFYSHLGAKEEAGRRYFYFTESELQSLCN